MANLSLVLVFGQTGSTAIRFYGEVWRRIPLEMKKTKEEKEKPSSFLPLTVQIVLVHRRQ